MSYGGSHKDGSLSQLRVDISRHDEVASQIFADYIDRLKGLVRWRLNERLRRGDRDSNDVAQDVLASFFKSSVDLNDPDEIWKLLCIIAKRHVCDVVRYHNALKRNATEFVLHNLENLVAGPTADDAIALEEAIESLTHEERQVITWKLQGWTHAEIAAKMGCSEKSVQRILKRIRTSWKITDDETAVST